MFEQLKENREVIKILSKLNKENSTGYIVGGAVRDTLLGITPHDIDFATNMEYSKVKELFSEYKCNETGKAFGVLRIKTPENEYEIAQYRKDLTSNDVEFVNKIEDDLSRRDFTINAMAWNETDGLIDKFGGKKDIWNKTLKFVAKDSKNADTTENIYIEGDNLEVLKLLRQNYYNSIKMIYIAPPYNTGNDFIYNDNFSMSKEESEKVENRLSEDGERLQKNPKEGKKP